MSGFLHLEYCFQGSSKLYIVFKVHPRRSMYQSFIPFYGWRAFHSCGYSAFLFIRSSADEHFSCFCLLATMNNAVDIPVQVFVWTYIFISPGSYIPRNRIDWSCGHSLRNCQTFSQSDCTILHLLWNTEVFHVGQVRVIYFLFRCSYLWCHR